MEFDCKRDHWRYLRFPARFIHKRFKIDDNVNFCIDTGSPRSIFMYETALKWGLPYGKLPKSEKPMSIAGMSADAFALEGGELIMRDMTGKLYTVPFSPVWVLGRPVGDKGLSQVVPGILGDDFISRFTLVIEGDKRFPGGRIYFTDQRVTTAPG